MKNIIANNFEIIDKLVKSGHKLQLEIDTKTGGLKILNVDLTLMDLDFFK